ncbi:MAG: permease [Pseudopedobacter saltans]|uniref:Permease n=1 Tax=Pseudopedobacter saltans TaxID=151895 RepID=A0A2W5FA24_9SPHI|nr:MAG: permease [Pseudopedobacter saltans]
MKILDWYIVKKYLSTFFFAIFLFAIISVVIDVGEKTDDFVKSGWTFRQIVMDYYIAFVPHIVALLFPLFVFIAVIFFTSKMAGRVEIIAILASGTSFSRFLRPFFVTSLILAGALYYMNSYIIPVADIKVAYFVDVYVHGNSSYNKLVANNNKPPLYYRIDSFTYAGFRNFDTTSKSGGPFYMYRIKHDSMDYNLRANTIRWDTAKKKWKLEGIFERHINGLKETVKLTPERLMNFTFRLSDLVTDEYAQNKMTTPQLKRHVEMERQRGGEDINTFEIELYRRQATPISVVVLTMIGAIIGSKKVRGGSGAHLAIGFVAAAIFILMDRFSTIFSTKGNFPPIIAAWLPNMVFSLVAIYLYRKSPK